jgi:hypothetical protein
MAEFDGNAEWMGNGHTLPRGPRLKKTKKGGPADRWTIEYEAESYSKYLAQLASFGIEIGFVSKVTDQVEVVFNILASPSVRTTTKAQERRAYFIHSDNRLKAWDLRVAQHAGIKPGGKIMVQFYPASTKKILADLELAAAAERQWTPDQIKRTTFKIRPAGAGYEYFVADMVAK